MEVKKEYKIRYELDKGLPIIAGTIGITHHLCIMVWVATVVLKKVIGQDVSRRLAWICSVHLTILILIKSEIRHGLDCNFSNSTDS